MAASAVSFEEKLALVVKVGEVSWNGEVFTFCPRTNDGYKMLSLKKGWQRTNSNIVSLIDFAFARIVSVDQKKVGVTM